MKDIYVEALYWAAWLELQLQLTQTGQAATGLAQTSSVLMESAPPFAGI